MILTDVMGRPVPSLPMGDQVPLSLLFLPKMATVPRYPPTATRSPRRSKQAMPSFGHMSGSTEPWK